MPLVQAKCESCGGILQVESSLKAANCPHCGSAYVVQDAINYYNSVTNIEHLHASVVNVVDESSAKARLEAADTYIKLKKYEEAYKEYHNVVLIKPQDYRGWWGMIVAKTHEFEGHVKSESMLVELDDYARSVNTLAPYPSKEDMLSRWQLYLTSERELNKKELDGLEAKIKTLEGKIRLNNQTENSLKSQAVPLNKREAELIARLNTKSIGEKFFDFLCGSSFLVGIIWSLVTWLFNGFGRFILSLVIWFFLTCTFASISASIRNKPQRELETVKAQLSSIQREIANVSDSTNSLMREKSMIQTKIKSYE